MEEAKLYWTIVAGVIGAGWVLMMFIRDRRSQSITLTSAIMSRLLEIDKIIIENPDIARYICKTATVDEAYFRNDAILEDDAFFKSKTYVYRILNTYDEILSVTQQAEKSSFLNPVPVIEPDDWKKYMIITLRHPLYRSIMENEADIFGESLRTFWNQQQEAIRSEPVDRYMW